MTIGVERTDFVGIPVTDRQRAVRFYGETLGLRRNPLASHRHAPYRDGSRP